MAQSSDIIDIQRITRAVEASTGFHAQELRKDGRSHVELYEARCILAHLAHKHQYTQQRIAKWCRSSSHSTINHRIRNCSEFLEVDRRFTRKYNKTEKILLNFVPEGVVKDIDDEIEKVREHLNNLMVIREKLI